jgi:hypothetical protein
MCLPLRWAVRIQRVLSSRIFLFWSWWHSSATLFAMCVERVSTYSAWALTCGIASINELHWDFFWEHAKALRVDINRRRTNRAVSTSRRYSNNPYMVGSCGACQSSGCVQIVSCTQLLHWVYHRSRYQWWDSSPWKGGDPAAHFNTATLLRRNPTSAVEVLGVFLGSMPKPWACVSTT